MPFLLICDLRKLNFVVSVPFLQGLTGLGLCQLPTSSPVGLNVCLADLYREFVSVGEALDQSFSSEKSSTLSNLQFHGTSLASLRPMCWSTILMLGVAHS